jgi:hypothetical protein
MRARQIGIERHRAVSARFRRGFSAAQAAKSAFAKPGTAGKVMPDVKGGAALG